MTYKKKHNGDDWNGILTDIIVHWLKHDWKRSWEKLARALSACNHKAIAAKIRKGEPLGMLDIYIFGTSDVFVICVLKTLGLQLPV